MFTSVKIPEDKVPAFRLQHPQKREVCDVCPKSDASMTDGDDGIAETSALIDDDDISPVSDRGDAVQVSILHRECMLSQIR